MLLKRTICGVGLACPGDRGCLLEDSLGKHARNKHSNSPGRTGVAILLESRYPDKQRGARGSTDSPGMEETLRALALVDDLTDLYGRIQNLGGEDKKSKVWYPFCA